MNITASITETTMKTTMETITETITMLNMRRTTTLCDPL